MHTILVNFAFHVDVFWDLEVWTFGSIIRAMYLCVGQSFSFFSVFFPPNRFRMIT